LTPDRTPVTVALSEPDRMVLADALRRERQRELRRAVTVDDCELPGANLHALAATDLLAALRALEGDATMERCLWRLALRALRERLRVGRFHGIDAATQAERADLAARLQEEVG
jgi:hypothetical protein